jgi:hypothetical protein
MRGQDQLDIHVRHNLGEDVRRNAAATQPGKRFGCRTLLGVTLRISGVIAAASLAMVLLGNICEVQEMRESARHGERVADGHVREQACELVESRLLFGSSGPFGNLAHLLHAIEKRLPFMVAEHPPQQLSKEPHIVSQRPVRIGAHPIILSG